MKRIGLFLLVLTMITAAGGILTAFDMGGTLNSGSGFSSSDASGISTELGTGLWLESGKGEHYSFEMKLDLNAVFSDDGFSFVLNPDFLKLDGLWDDLNYGPSILATSLGRFTTSDFSTKIFSQKLDGLIMNFNYPAVELTIAAGTTALMFADTGSILTTTPPTIMSKTDAAQNAGSTTLASLLFDPAAKGKSVLDSPRAVEILTLTLPRIVAGQSFTFSVVAQEDLRPMLEVLSGYSDSEVKYPLLQEGESTYYPDKGGAVDTQYFGAGVSGASIESLYHNVYYYFGTGRSLTYLADGESPTGYSYQYAPIYSHMAGFSLDYYMPWLFNSRAAVGLNFGTGDADADSIYEGNRADNYTQFTPITSGGGGMIFSPGLSNVLSANISYSIKPLEWLNIPFISNMQVAVTGMPFFRLTEGPIAVSGVSPNFSAEDGNYLGSEIDLSVNMRPFSDLGVSLMAGCFLPDKDAFAGSDLEDPTIMAKLNVSLSF